MKGHVEVSALTSVLATSLCLFDDCTALFFAFSSAAENKNSVVRSQAGPSYSFFRERFKSSNYISHIFQVDADSKSSS